MKTFLICLWLISCPSFAAVHVCTDADGRKVFTDGDCPSSFLVKKQIEIVVVPASPGQGVVSSITKPKPKPSMVVYNDNPCPEGYECVFEKRTPMSLDLPRSAYKEPLAEKVKPVTVGAVS